MSLDRLVKKNILVLEDDISMQLMLQTTLEVKGGYHVDVAANGWEGLVALTHSEFNYQAAIVDYNMPFINGLQFIERARTNYGHNIPMLLHSGEIIPHKDLYSMQKRHPDVEVHLKSGDTTYIFDFLDKKLGDK